MVFATRPILRRHLLRALLFGSALAGLPAGGALAETLTVTDIAIPLGVPFAATVPSIEIVDGNLDEATVRAIFTGSEAAIARLADLDAVSLVIPEITLVTSMGVPDADSTTTYRNVRLEDVVDGVAARVVVESTESRGAYGFTMNFGEMSAARFDIAGLLGFYGFAPQSASTEMKEVYGDFYFAGGYLGSPLFSCTFGESTGGNFSARPLQQPWSAAYAAIQDLAALESSGDKPTPEQIRQVIDFYLDILTAFSTTPMELTSFACSGEDDKGEAFALSFGPVRAGGFEPGIYPDFGLDALSVTGPDATSVELDNFTWKRMDFSGAIEALRHAAALDEAWFEANWRRLVPAMDGFSFDGLRIDAPNPESRGERIAASVGGFDATLGKYVNGMPSDISLTLDGLVVPVTADMAEPPVSELLAYGVSQLTLGLATKLHWNEADSTIVVDELLVDAGELGRVSVSGVLGNATSVLFGDDVEAAALAAQMLTVKQITVEIKDRGIGPILFAAGARESGQPEPSFRTAISGMAQGMTLAMLGNTDEALQAAQALGAFLGGASELKLTLTSVDPAGLGIIDFAAAEADPTALAGKFTVAAEAGGEPAPVLERVEPAPEPEPQPEPEPELQPEPAPAEELPSLQEQKRDLKAAAPRR